jgi:hypothetical protein
MQNKNVIFITLSGLLAFNGGVRADLISDWGGTAGTHISQNTPGHFQAWRGHTMVRVAMFDAANAALGGYTPYALNVAAPGASPEAAVAQAAYTVLTNLSSAGLASLNTALTTSLATVPNGPATDAGIQIGRRAGEAIIRLRAGDNPALSVPYINNPVVGRWRPTPPNYAAAFGTQGRYLTPWTMRSAAQFRPGPPPALTSDIYTADYNEIRVLGSRGNTNRTPEQAASAQLHEKGENWIADVYNQHPLPLLESARREALFWMAGMDAAIQIYDAKYTYDFWRPVTAINNGAVDGNDATPGDAAWTPFLDTHNHPDYPSYLVLVTAAVAEILIQLHGDNFSFSATSQNPSSTRTFARLSDYVEDAITARVVGGTHFRNTCNVSAEVGRRIARHAFKNYLRPVPRLQTGPGRPGEFTLFLELGLPVPYTVETSRDLLQWLPWQTNIHGVISMTDTNAPVGERFYRAVLGMP